jgi:hypothetical protein
MTWHCPLPQLRYVERAVFFIFIFFMCLRGGRAALAQTKLRVTFISRFEAPAEPRQLYRGLRELVDVVQGLKARANSPEAQAARAIEAAELAELERRLFKLANKDGLPEPVGTEGLRIRKEDAMEVGDVVCVPSAEVSGVTWLGKAIRFLRCGGRTPPTADQVLNGDTTAIADWSPATTTHVLVLWFSCLKGDKPLQWADTQFVLLKPTVANHNVISMQCVFYKLSKLNKDGRIPNIHRPKIKEVLHRLLQVQQ